MYGMYDKHDKHDMYCILLYPYTNRINYAEL